MKDQCNCACGCDKEVDEDGQACCNSCNDNCEDLNYEAYWLRDVEVEK